VVNNRLNVDIDYEFAAGSIIIIVNSSSIGMISVNNSKSFKTKGTYITAINQDCEAASWNLGLRYDSKLEVNDNCVLDRLFQINTKYDAFPQDGYTPEKIKIENSKIKCFKLFDALDVAAMTEFVIRGNIIESSFSVDCNSIFTPLHYAFNLKSTSVNSTLIISILNNYIYNFSVNFRLSNISNAIINLNNISDGYHLFYSTSNSNIIFEKNILDDQDCSSTSSFSNCNLIFKENNITIKNLKSENFFQYRAQGKNLNFINNTISHDAKSYAIEILPSAASNINVSDNEIFKKNGYAIHNNSVASAPKIIGNKITLENNGTGIQLNSTSKTEQNVIICSDASDDKGVVILSDFNEVKNNTIRGNSYIYNFGDQRYGIEIEEGQFNKISCNTISKKAAGLNAYLDNSPTDLIGNELGNNVRAYNLMICLK
jgi:hypothetical protein